MNAMGRIGICLLVALAPLAGHGVEVGDPAPEFELQGSDGELHRLTDHRGQSVVVLAWFPKAYTRGCTIECKSLAQKGHLIREFEAAYFMASVDPLADNIGFAREQQADFPLLSDPTKEVAAAYGVLTGAGYAARHTFYVGLDGTVIAIDRAVRPATAAEDIAAKLAELGVARKVAQSSRDRPMQGHAEVAARAEGQTQVR